jgi:hypothetical protein
MRSDNLVRIQLVNSQFDYHACLVTTRCLRLVTNEYFILFDETLDAVLLWDEQYSAITNDRVIWYH